MLLWEALCSGLKGENKPSHTEGQAPQRRIRLPFDHRCAAITKSGKRCRGKNLPGAEFCLFHDPAIAEKRRLSLASAGRRRNPLSRLPDGYLRKLSSRAAVGEAMDRLYREVRLGIVTPEMGSVLFTLLSRMLDSGLCDARRAPRRPAQSKAERVRPKLAELLTAPERAAWRKAVANAPPRLLFQPAEPVELVAAVAVPTDAPAREAALAPETARLALKVS